MIYIKETISKIKKFRFNPYYKLIFFVCLFIYSCGPEINLQETLSKKQLKEEKRKARKEKRKEKKSNKDFLAYYNTYYQAKVKFKEAIEEIEFSNYNNLSSEIKPPISKNTETILDEAVKYADIILDDYYNTEFVYDASYIKARASYLKNVMSPAVYFFNKIIENPDSPYYYDSLVRLGFIRLLVDDKEGLLDIINQLDDNIDNFNNNNNKLKKKLPYKFIKQDLDNVTSLYYYLKAKSSEFLGNSIVEAESFYLNAVNNTDDQIIYKKIYYYNQLIAFLEENNKHESSVKYMNEVSDYIYVGALSDEFLLKWLDYNREFGFYNELHKKIDKILKRNVESFDDEIFFLIEKAKTYIHASEIDKGVNLLNSIIDTYGEDELKLHKELYSEIYYQLGKVSLDQYDFSVAYNYFSQSFEIMNTIKNSNITQKLKLLTSLKDEYLILTDTLNIVIETEIDSLEKAQEENNPFYIPIPDSIEVENDSYVDSLLFDMGRIFFYDLEIEDFAISSLSELLKDYKNSNFIPDAIKMLDQIKPEINWVDSFAIDLMQFIKYDEDRIESSKIENARDIAFDEMAIDINNAINLFESNYKEYDDLLSLYMIGYIYDKYLNDIYKTLEYYQLYIDNVSPLYGDYLSVDFLGRFRLLELNKSLNVTKLRSKINKIELDSNLPKLRSDLRECQFNRDQGKKSLCVEIRQEIHDINSSNHFIVSSIQDSISVFEESVISNEEISDSKPTLINVWFQECESCSYLKELNAKYSNNEIDIINILVVDNHRDQMYYDYIEYLEGVSYYLKSLDFPFPVYEQEKNISVFGSIKNFFNDRQEKSYSLLINDNFIIEKFAGYDDETKIKIDKAINKVLNNEEDVESDPRFYPPFLAVKHLKQAKEKINNTKSDFVRELDTKYALKLFKQGYDLIHDYGLEFADSATFYHIKEGFRFGKRGNIEDSYANINTTKWRNLRDKLIELKELPSLKTLEEDLFDTSLVKADDIFKAATLLYKGFNNTELSKKYYEIYAKRFFDGNDIENVYLALKNIDFNNREKWDSLYIEKIKLDFSEYEKLNYNRANDIMAVVKKRQQPKDLVASYTVKYKEFEYQINRLYISEGQKQLVTIYNSFDYYSFNNKPYVSSKEDFKDSLYLLYGVRPHHITRATLNYDSKSIPFRTNEEVDYNKLSPSLPFIYGSNIYYAEFLYRSKKDYRFRLNKNIDECEYKGKKYSCFEIESYPKNDIIIPENAIDVFQSMSHYEWDDEKWGRHSSFEIGKHITKIIEVNDNILIPIEDITLNFGLDTMIVKEIEYEDIGGIYYLPNQIKISYKDDKDNLYIDLDKYSINNSLDEYANLFFLNNISNKSKKDDDEDKYVRVQRLRYKSDQRQQRRKNPFTYISDEPEWIDNFIGLNEVGFEEYSDIDINKIDEQIQHIEQLYYDLFDETFIIPEPEEHEDYTRKSSDPNYVHDILQGNSYFIGNDSAPITITKFFDFQCPYCAKSRGIIEDILYEYPEDVKIVFKSFPLGSHKQAFKTAKYALAAGRQGKFYEMYSKIFENDNWRNLKFDENLPKTFAVELGLDIDQLEKDMNDPALENQINAEYNQLKSLGNSYDTEQYKGVRLAVPKFFINGREPSSRTIQAWSKIIEEELCDLDSLEINYYSDGSKRYEIQIEDCKREGIAEYWDELGNLSKTVEFKNGKLNGEKNTYYPSGKIKETSTYKNDKLNGTLIKYDVDGDTIQTVTYKNNDIILPGYVIFSINNAATSYVQSTKQYFYFVDDALINGEELISSDWIIAYNNSTIVGARQYTKDNTDVPIMGFDSLTESLKIATEGYCEIGDIPIIRVYRENGDIVEMNVTVTEGDLEFKGIGHARVTLNGTIED